MTADRAQRRQYAKTAQRRADIVEAATVVFAARGYHGGSLRDIARQLDLSLTSLVHHFPTKSELLLAVLEHADVEAESLSPIDDGEDIRIALRRRWIYNYGHPELLRLLAIVASEASAPDHPAHGWFIRRYDIVVDRFAAAIEREKTIGRVDADIDARKSAHIIVAAWDGLQLQWLLRPDDDLTSDFELLLERVLGPLGGDVRPFDG